MASGFGFNFEGSPATPSGKGKGINFSQGPSTTPAGPPPSYLTNFSTTPAGEPPRSSKIFGSSYNPSQNTFGHRNTPGRSEKSAFRVPSSSPPAPSVEHGDDDMEDEYDDEEDAPGEFIASTIERDPQRGLKRSHNGQIRDSGMADIARAYVRNNGPAREIEDKDDVVLKTESALAELDSTMHHPSNAVGSRDEIMTNTAADLTRLWALHSNDKTLPGGIGPEFDESFTKASYVSSLLLQLHYSHTTNAPQQQKSALVRQSQVASSAVPPARALLDWLNKHHNPLPDDFNDVHLHRPSPSAHEAFWDIVGGDLIRGRFVRVVWLLRDARWENAATAAGDYEDERARGYRGSQLENTEAVVERCIRLLESCPAVTDDNWNLTGPEWSIFRQRVRHAIRELETFATALEEHAPAAPRANIFGDSATSMAAATARAESRVPPTIYQNLRALYGALLGGNGILDYAQDWLEASILLTVWWDGEESTAALNASVADLAASNNGLRKSTRAGGATREVDVAPMAAYRRKLGDTFRIIPGEIDEPNFQPDSLDPVHVALATVLEDDVTEAIGIIRSWSQTLASAVVELAVLGNWLPISEGRPNSRGLLGRGFSTDDLMVLSHGPGGRASAHGGENIDRDDVLSSYANLLAIREKFKSEDGRLEREGWELAISVLSRLNDDEAAQDKIRAVLEAMEIHDETRVEKVLAVCSSMGFEELGRGIAERYADSLSTATPLPYGTALFYYARAHAIPKLHSTLSLLISLSLLHSAAMPPTTNLDARLASLLSPNRTALMDLARIDASAAELLSQHLSGYAMLRRFYDIRDGKSGSELTRLQEAAKTLVAVIESASDCIKGGLFDPEIESVVPVEGLLALLGEALPFFGRASPANGRPQRVLPTKNILRLMAVVEDYEQVSGRIREGGEGLLRASMSCFRGGSSGSRVLGKSTGALSATSASGLLSGSEGWEQLAESSWSLLQQSEQSGGSNQGRGGRKKNQVLEIARGWDWRVGLDAVTDGSGVESSEVVLLLRTALAREMAGAWAAGWE